MPLQELVTVLIAPPQSGSLSPSHVSEAVQALPNARPGRWLSPGEAAEVPFFGSLEDRQILTEKVRSRLGSAPVDIAVLSAEHRRKRLLVADMDSTLIGQECIDELAALAGVGAQVAAITDKSMRGELDFEQSLAERVRLLSGLPETALAEVLTSRISLNAGARSLAATMRRHGALTAIVSGGFAAFTGHVRACAGFDRDFSNRLEIDNGVLTGRLVPPVLGRNAKRETLLTLTNELGLAVQETLAVGDGANDIEMIRAAGLGVAYRAKPALRSVADACIDRADLTALLFLQGYRAQELVLDASRGRQD